MPALRVIMDSVHPGDHVAVEDQDEEYGRGQGQDFHEEDSTGQFQDQAGLRVMRDRICFIADSGSGLYSTYPLDGG